jgi:hypothetical protein
MAHAKREELQDLGALLDSVRGLEALKEKSFGCFYRKGKGVLHIHVQQGRRFAHVSDGKTWHEVDLPAGVNQRKALGRMRELLLP